MVATGLLLAAAGVWAATHWAPLPPIANGYVRAAAEAGMIGGLADWFAVTALFRRPLGLPIPHTALIPANQSRIAEGVARYIDHEFLDREMLVRQVAQMDVAGRIAALLQDPGHRARIVGGLMQILPRLIEGRGDGRLSGALAEIAQAAAQRTEMRGILARLLRSLEESAEIGRVIGGLSDTLQDTIRDRRDTILEVVARHSGRLVPRFIDRRLTDRIVAGLIDHLERLKDPDSEEGRALGDWFAGLAGRIERGEDVGHRGVAMVAELFRTHGGAVLTQTLRGELRRMALDDLAGADSKIRAVLDTMVDTWAQQLDDPALRRDVNAAVELVLAENIPAWRAEIRGFIAGTLARQNSRDFVRRIELQIGRDLQYIRINGTVIGAAIGALIHLANRLAGG